jgi:site-specific DNA recombinase
MALISTVNDSGFHQDGRSLRCPRRLVRRREIQYYHFDGPLSFAQFEREVTGERIRDKFAASKRKGIWMGGLVALGYEVRDRQLVINEAEAATVRRIFTRYCELGSVRLLKEELDRNGVRSKIRVSKDGVESGGQAFSRGALYTLLGNPIYVG